MKKKIIVLILSICSITSGLMGGIILGVSFNTTPIKSKQNDEITLSQKVALKVALDILSEHNMNRHKLKKRLRGLGFTMYEIKYVIKVLYGY